MLGLTGSHRAGKSTLARAIANKADLPFVPTNVSGFFHKLGLDPAQPFDFAERLRIQILLLNELTESVWGRAPGDAVTDRTPIDLLAYTLAEVQGHTLTNETEAMLAMYADQCFRNVNYYFHALVLVQPGIPIIAEPGKASLSPGYMAHLNAIFMGLLLDERLKARHFYIPRHITDLQMRIAAVERVWQRTLEGSMNERLEVGHSPLLH